MAKKIKLPVLMYHEVTGDIELRGTSFQMTPSYFMSQERFERQLGIFTERGYESIVFEDVPNISGNGKYVMITFDDGWAGNFRYALPILREYGFKAIFFVTVGLIGSKGYMKWDEVAQLAAEGMSVQSHGMTHRPLQSLDQGEIYDELLKSKLYIEGKLNSNVAAFSFPHGSFDKKIVKCAYDVGYNALCTSEMKRNFASDFLKKNLLGRITMTRELPDEKFIRLVEYNSWEVAKAFIKKKAKNGVKRMMGIENYRRMYRRYFKIIEPSSVD